MLDSYNIVVSLVLLYAVRIIIDFSFLMTIFLISIYLYCDSTPTIPAFLVPPQRAMIISSLSTHHKRGWQKTVQ